MKRNGMRTLSRIAAVTVALMMMACGAFAEETAVSAGPARIELSTQYPAMVVKAGDSLTFDLDIDNQSGISQNVTLSVESIPEGWTGSFSASGKQVSIVHVKSGDANTSVDFALDIPLETADGDYSVELKAQGEGYNDTMRIAITVNAEEIGESSFEAKYPSQEGDAGTAFTFNATLINNTLSAQSYAFSSNAPTGWTVSFKPSVNPPRSPLWMWKRVPPRGWTSPSRRRRMWKRAPMTFPARRLPPRKPCPSTCPLPLPAPMI